MKQEVIDGTVRKQHFKGFSPRKKSKFAKLGFVFGIIGIPTGIYFFGIVFAILALVFSAKGFKELESDFESYRKEKWKMVLGKVLGWIGIGMSLTYGIFMLFIFGSAMLGRDRPFDFDDNYNDSYYGDEYYNDEWEDFDDESFGDDTYDAGDSPF